MLALACHHGSLTGTGACWLSIADRLLPTAVTPTAHCQLVLPGRSASFRLCLLILSRTGDHDWESPSTIPSDLSEDIQSLWWNTRVHAQVAESASQAGVQCSIVELHQVFDMRQAGQHVSLNTARGAGMADASCQLLKLLQVKPVICVTPKGVLICYLLPSQP